MPLYYLLVGRRMESVLGGSMSISAVLTARSLDVCLCVTAMLYSPYVENALNSIFKKKKRKKEEKNVNIGQHLKKNKGC